MSTANRIALSSIVRRRSGLSAQDVDDTLVVTDETTTWCYGMECIARQIWQLLDCPRTVGDLSSALMDGYEIDRERCDSDVLEFLEELNREGLIEIVRA
jgi:hypothetical protein